VNLRQLRWPVVLTALVVTLGGLFAGGQLVKSRTVDQPLATALSGVEGLESYRVERVGDLQEIVVLPGPDANLKETYRAVERQVRQVLKDAPHTITVEDRRGETLSGAADRLDLYVAEAMATGAFADMADRIAAEVHPLGAEAEVTVDGQRVYVAVRLGDEYLYSVADRPAWPAGAAAGGGGGL